LWQLYLNAENWSLNTNLHKKFEMNQNNDFEKVLSINAERIDNNTIEIKWIKSLNFQEIFVFKGESPDKIDMATSIAFEREENSIKVKEQGTTKRFFYYIKPHQDDGLLVGERRVAMESTVNFRDLGGYKNNERRSVKWGQLFRADTLQRLTDSDYALLEQMSIKLICDLRTEAEVEKAPDNIPDDSSMEYWHTPITRGEFSFVKAMDQIKQGDTDWLNDEFMAQGYLENLDKFPATWGDIINRIAMAENRPMLFHCTGGKDRTGTLTALLLLAMDVPEETVIFDHQLSNKYIAKLLERIYANIEAQGVDPKLVVPYFTAPLLCITSMLRHLKESYGSATEYLQEQAGVSEKTLITLKDQLLD